MKKILFLFATIFILYFGGRIALAWDKPNSQSTERVAFSIQKGMTLTEISNLLKEKKLIRDPLVFRIYARWNKQTTKFQAGDYIVLRNLTMEELSDILQRGKTQEASLTIPEGFTIAQIDELLAKKGLLSPGEFQKCANNCNFDFKISSLEGFLFPSTYYVATNNFSAQSFITRLYNTFQKQIEPHQDAISKSKRTLEEIVIMASMIEREAFKKDEMPMIAGVLWKRLDEGIALGVDATTRYELKDWKRALLTADFEKDTPYNTRRKKGMPPTAISNPGKDALLAAIYPEDSKYYYYLHDAKRKIHFAETYEDHVKNKNKYLR